MVILEEIKRQNNIISTKYIAPLNLKSIGYIEYDIDKDEVVKVIYNEDDENHIIKLYYAKALKCLKHKVACGFPDGKVTDRYEYYWY